MPLLECTVVYEHVTNNVDDPSSTAVGTVKVMGDVLFIPQLPDGVALAAGGVAHTVQPFPGYVDTDGVLKNAPAGTPGVRIWANDPALGLTQLRYKVTFNLTDGYGRPIDMRGCAFNAPDYDTEIDLSRYLWRGKLHPFSMSDHFGTELDGGSPGSAFDDDLDGGSP